MPKVDVRIDLSPLQNMLAGLDVNYTTKVGILGSGAYREDESGLTNAEVGFKQEFGSITENIPIRSFLRFPIEYKSGSIISKLLSNKDEILNKIKDGDLKYLNEALGVLAEAAIQDAFATRGYGQWQPNSPVTIASKGSSSPLIDTGELRKSITSTVNKNG